MIKVTMLDNETTHEFANWYLFDKWAKKWYAIQVENKLCHYKTYKIIGSIVVDKVEDITDRNSFLENGLRKII